MDETETLDEFPPPPSLDELLMYGQIQQFEPDVLAGAVKRWRDDVRSYGESKMRDSDPHGWFRGNTMLDNDVQGTLDQLRESARTAGAGEDVTESDAFRINSVRTKIVPLKSDSGMILGDFEAQSRHDGGGLDLLLRVDNKDEAERAEIRTMLDFGMGRKVSEDTVDRSKRKALSIPAVTDDDRAAAIEAAKAEAAWQRKKEADYTEIANVSDRSQPAGDIYGAPNPNGAIGRRNAEIARIKAQEQEDRANALAHPSFGPRILLEERVKEAVKADPDLAGSIGTVDLGEDFWRGLQQTRLGTRMAIADAMGDEDVKADVRQAIADLPLSYPGSTRLNYNGGLGSFISDGSAVLGGMAPTVATALVGGPLGAAGGASSAIVRTAAMAPLSASAYGNSYAGMLNEADAMEAQGDVAGAAQRRKDARSKAFTDAIIETGSEFIFAEEMMRIAGNTFLRKVAKGAASNTIEEFVAAVGGAESNLAFRDEVTTSGEIARQSALGAFAGGFMQVPAGIAQVILPARPTQDGDAPLESPGDSAVINIDGRTFALQQVGDLAGQWMEAGRDGDGNIANTPLNPETDADVIAQLEEVRGRLNQGEMPEADIPEMDDAPVRPLINDFVDEGAAIAKEYEEEYEAFVAGVLREREAYIVSRLSAIESELGPRDEVDINNPSVSKPIRILTSEENALITELEEIQSQPIHRVNKVIDDIDNSPEVKEAERVIEGIETGTGGPFPEVGAFAMPDLAAAAREALSDIKVNAAGEAVAPIMDELTASAQSDELNSQVDVEVASNPSGPLEVLNTKDEPINKASGLNARITTRFDPATETVSYGLERVNAAGKVLPFIGAPESFPTEQAARDYIVSALGEQEVKTDAPVATEKQDEGETDPLMLFMANNKINLVPDINTEGAIARRKSKGLRALDRDKNKVSNRKMAPTQADYNGNPVAQGRLSSISDRNSSNAMDVVAQSAFDRNLIAQPTVDALFDGIRSSLGKVGGEATITSAEMAQDAAENEQQSQQAAANKFFGGFTSPLRNDVTTPASLQIGDTLTVGDDVVTVIDKDDAGVTLESQNFPGEHLFDYEDSIGYDAINDSKGAEVDLDRRESLAKEGVVTADEAADLTKTIRENPSAGKNATAISSQDHTAYSRDSKELDVARRLANFFGLRIVGVSGLGGNAAVLRDDNKNIYLDVDADRAIIVLTAHELLHQMRQNARELYDMLLSTLRADPNYKQGLADYVAELRPEHRGRPMDLIEEEFLADYLMDQGAEPAFWEKLAQAEPGMFEELVEFIRKFLNDVRDFIKESKLGAAKYLKDADAMERAMVKALVEFRDSQELNAGWTTPGTGAVMESVVDDNMPFADKKTSSKQDAEYLTLAADPVKNQEKLKEMVDEAARAAGYDSTSLLLHGTARKFTKFSREMLGANTRDTNGELGFFFTSKEFLANDYADLAARGGWGGKIEAGGKPRIMNVFLRLENPFMYETASQFYREGDKWKGNFDGWREQFTKDGYDGVIVRSDKEEVIAFNPNQIKSADPVTYDESGNVIPLSERFDSEKDDIRFADRKSPQDALTGATFYSSVQDAEDSQPVKFYRGRPKSYVGNLADPERQDYGPGAYYTDDIRAAQYFSFREDAEDFTGVSAYNVGGNLFRLDTLKFDSPELREIVESFGQEYKSDEWKTIISNSNPYTRLSAMAGSRVAFSEKLKELGYDGMVSGFGISDLSANAKQVVLFNESVANQTSLPDGFQGADSVMFADKKQDDEYLALAKDPEGNREKLQAMVDEAAQAAGYDVGPVFHGTTSKELVGNKFDEDFVPYRGGILAFFAQEKSFADGYAKNKKGEGSVYAVYLKAGNILSFQDPSNIQNFIESFYNSGNKINSDDAARLDLPLNATQQKAEVLERFMVGDWLITEADDLVEWANKSGYDAIMMSEGGSNNYGVFNPSQIKSADPVTYDESGNVIPLSKRFDSEKDDIRFADRRIPKETVARHSELEAKHNAGTLTPEEEQEAGRIVEEAARGAGYGTEAWHYTNADIDDILTKETARTQSDIQGVFFMDRPDEYREYGNNEYHVYLKLENPTNYDTAYGGFRGDRYDAGIRQREKIQSEGFDSVVIPADEMGMDYGEIIVFDSNQIKSADPFTGVPLDQRFNSEIVDMRFADRKPAATPKDVSRFSELTSALPGKPTQADIDAFKKSNPAEYAELKEMRERVLGEAGFNAEVWHGTAADFDTPKGKRGLAAFVSLDRSSAEWFASAVAEEMTAWGDPNNGGKVLQWRLRGEYFDPRRADHRSRIQSEVDARNFQWEDMEATWEGGSTPLQNEIREAGFDGYMVSEGTGKPLDTIAVFSPNRIKSTEPLNLDESGNLITPDKWGDSVSDDIRFADYKGQVFGNEGVAESAKVQGFVDELIPKVKEDHFDGDYPVNPYQTDYAFKKLKALENGEIDLREQYGENGLNKDGANQVLIGELMQYAHRMMREDGDSSLYEALNDRANKAAKGEASAAGRVLNVRQWYTRQFDKASGVIREAKSEIIKKVYGKSGESEIEDVQDNLKTALEAVRELSPEGRKTVLAAVAKGRSDKATSLGEQMGTAISGKKKPGKAVAAVVEEALSFMESLDDMKFADWLGNDQEKVAIRDKIIREKITHGKRSWSQFKAGLMRVGYSEEFAKQAFVKASELHEKAKAAKAADIATSKAEKEEPSYAEQFLATSDAEAAMTDRINAKAGKAIDAVNGTKKPRKPSTQSPDPIKQLVKDSLATGDNFNRLETIKAAIVLGFTDKSAREFADAVEARLANEKAKREAKTDPAKIAREISDRFNNPVDRPPSKKEPIRKLVRLALNQRSTVTESSFMAEMKTLGVPKLEAANLWGDIVKDRALREQMRDLKRKADAEHSGSSSEKEAQAIMQKLWNVPGKSNPRAKSTVEQFYDDELGYGKQRSLSDFVDGLTAVGVDKGTATRLYELATIERVNRLELAKQKKIAKVLATADGFKPSAGPITLKRQVKADKRTAASIEKEILNHPQLRIVGPEVRIQIQAKIFRDRAGLSLVDAYAAAQEFDKDLQARWIEAGERVVEKVTTKRNAPFVRKERGKGAKKPSPTQFDALVKAIRAGALDPRKRVLDEVAKANGWIDLTPGELQRLAELDELLHGRGLTKPQIERLSELNLKERASELTDEEIAERKAFVDRQAEGLTGFEHVRLHRQMIEIYSSSSMPDSVLKIIGQSITANIFAGPSTLLIGFSGILEIVGAMTRDTALSVVGSTIGKKTSIAEVRNMTGMMQAMMRGKDYFQQAINDAMLTARTGETRSVVAEEITDFSDSLDRVWMRQQKVLDNPSASPSAKANALGAMVYTVGRFVYRALKTVDAFVKGGLGRYVKELELFSRAANLGWTSKQIKGLVNAVAANGEIYAAEADAKGFTGSDKRVYIEARTEESMLRAFRDEGIEVDDILNRSGREANLATGMGQIQDGSYTLGKVAQAAKWFRKEAPIAGPLMVPAVQTPYNVVHRGVWWTPFAIHRYLITAKRTQGFKNWEDSSYQEALADPVQLALRATETALGTALFGGLAKLLFDQMGEDDEDKWLRVNLAGPSTSSRLERSAWLNAGNRPFALQFKTDKGWATLGFRRGGFEVFNFAMTVIGAAEQQKYEKWISSDSAWERYGLTLSKELLGESLFFMRGSTSRGVSMDSIGNEVGFRASSFVPLSSMWKTATRFDDMKEREAGFWGNFAMQMPLVGALSDRRPAINSLGQEVGFNETSNFYVQSKLNIPLGWVPSEAPDKTKTNPGYKDLLGLMHNKKAFVSAYSKSSFDSSLKRASTDAEFYDFLKLRGELSVEEMKKRYTSLWKMDKEEFKEELSNISTEATKQAKKKMGIKTR